MPIPKPKPKERRKDFINRCVSELSEAGDYKDAKQRGGVCGTAWEESKREVANMADLKAWEIAKAGKWIAENGKVYIFTNEMIEALARNYNDMVESDEAPFRLGYVKVGGHDYFDVENLPAAGWVRHLSVSVDKNGFASAYADVEDVPEGIRELINQNALKKVSPEIVLGEGPTDIHLRAVSLMGARRPAIKGMAPAKDAISFASKEAMLAAFGASADNVGEIAHLFSDNTQSEKVTLLSRFDDNDSGKVADFADTQKGNEMTKEYSDEQIAQIKKDAAAEALKNADHVSLSEAKTAAEKRAEMLKERAEKAESELKRQRLSAASSFAEGLKDTHKVKPAVVDGLGLVKFAEKLAEEATVVKLSEGEPEVSLLDQFTKTVNKLVSFAAKGELFVPQGEQLTVNKDEVVELSEGGQKAAEDSLVSGIVNAAKEV